MNYADLFRVTLPETALEVAALLVLVVDLGLLRKAALKTRVAVAALLGVVGCGAALWAQFWAVTHGAWTFAPEATPRTCCCQRVDLQPSRSRGF